MAEAQLDDLEQYGRRENLQIPGVPLKREENTNEVVKSVVSSLNVRLDDNQISTSHRLAGIKSQLNINFSCIVNKSDEYFSRSNLSSLTANLLKNDLFLIHFNVSSHAKNKTKMHELIDLMVAKPNVIAISETKLNPNSVSNVNL